MLTLRDALFGLGLPTLIGVVLFFLASRPRTPVAGPPERWLRDASLGSGPALGIGFVLAFEALQGAPPWPPVEAVQWVCVAAVAMLTLQIFELVEAPPGTRHWGGAVRAALIAAVIGLAIAAIVRPLALQTWTTRESAEWIAGLWIGGMLLWGCLAHHGAKSAGLCSAWAIAAMLIMASVVLAMSGSQTYGQLAAALPAVWAPLALLATLSCTRILAEPTAAMLVLLYGGLLLCGHLYAELTAVNALLLGLAPLGLCTGDLPRVRAWQMWQRGLLQLAASLAPASIATALALTKFVHDVTERSQAGY
jgi:hypothetical protein